MSKPAGIDPARTEYDRRVIEAVAPGPADVPRSCSRRREWSGVSVPQFQFDLSHPKAPCQQGLVSLP